jgi:hypothetical protein
VLDSLDILKSQKIKNSKSEIKFKKPKKEAPVHDSSQQRFSIAMMSSEKSLGRKEVIIGIKFGVGIQ